MNQYDELKAAVVAHLDTFHREDEDGERISWPSDLEELVEWNPPEERR